MHFMFFLMMGGIAFLLTGVFRQFALRGNWLDKPNMRSAHTVPTPRGGGLVPIGLLIVLLSFLEPYYRMVLLPPLTAIAAISFADDYINLKARWRFVIHVLAALYFLVAIHDEAYRDFTLLTQHAAWVLTPFFFIVLLWSTNLFNFMDGSDGLAAMEAIFIFFIGGLLLWFQYKAFDLAYLCFFLTVVMLGFLPWNWPRAKIFMGDVGSTSLGFLIPAIGMLAQKEYHMPILLWAMLYGLFIFDSSVTLLRRILKKRKWHEGHLDHMYQRLYRSGWSHLKILWLGAGLNGFILIEVVLASIFTKFILLLALGEILVLSFIYIQVEKKIPL